MPNPINTKLILAKLLPYLDWRVHGLGVLQAYIKEGESKELRVHVWHPDLCTTQDTGRPHNHRFDLMSNVLVGSLVHEVWHLVPDDNGEWVKYSVVHARKQSKTSDDMKLQSYETYKAEKVRFTVTEGNSYYFEKGKFHRTIVDALCVTLVEKTNQSGSATILGYRDSVKHSFVDTKHIDNCTVYIEAAIKALGG